MIRRRVFTLTIAGVVALAAAGCADPGPADETTGPDASAAEEIVARSIAFHAAAARDDLLPRRESFEMAGHYRGTPVDYRVRGGDDTITRLAVR